MGLVEVDTKWVTASRVDAGKTWDDFVRSSRSDRAKDSRLLGDSRDSDGLRHLAFRDALGKSKEETLVGYPLKGPRLAREMMSAIRDAGQDSYDEHHSVGVRRSGVAEKSAAAREHR